ncbi:MAG: hypothetical protein KQH63_08055 [Desulfobulbaceae bacterium]|nr:hypothetical protein [Desulfobulbaceae bacterium]
MKKTVKKIGICFALVSLISIGFLPAFASDEIVLTDEEQTIITDASEQPEAVYDDSAAVPEDEIYLPEEQGEEEYEEVPQDEEYQYIDGENDGILIEEEGQYEYIDDPEQEQQYIEEYTEGSDIVYEDGGEAVDEGQFVEGEEVPEEYIEVEEQYEEAPTNEIDQGASIEELENLPGIGELPEIPAGE